MQYIMLTYLLPKVLRWNMLNYNCHGTTPTAPWYHGIGAYGIPENIIQRFVICISLTDLKYGIRFVILFIVVNGNNKWCSFGLDEEKITDSLLLFGS
jgi:hypothetical protein